MCDNELLKLRISNFDETENYLRGEVENVFTIIWKKAPTKDTLDQALLPALSNLNLSSDKVTSLLIISVAMESVSFKTNQYAKSIMKQYAKQVKPMAVVDHTGTRCNRIELRMLLVIAGFFGLGPLISFHTNPLEACEWIAAERTKHNIGNIDKGILTNAIQWMLSRCPASNKDLLVTHPWLAIRR